MLRCFIKSSDRPNFQAKATEENSRARNGDSTFDDCRAVSGADWAPGASARPRGAAAVAVQDARHVGAPPCAGFAPRRPHPSAQIQRQSQVLAGVRGMSISVCSKLGTFILTIIM